MKTFIQKITWIKSKNPKYIAKRIVLALEQATTQELVESYDYLDTIFEKYLEQKIIVSSKKLKAKIAELNEKFYG